MMRFIVDQLARGVHLVRFIYCDKFVGVTNVIEENRGRTLKFVGLHASRMPTLDELTAARDVYFPRATRVLFEHRDLKTGASRWFERKLRPTKPRASWVDRTLAAFEEQLRAYYGLPRVDVSTKT